MTTHIIYIYLIINSFIAGNYLFDTFNDDKGFKKFVTFSVLFLFGAPLVLISFIVEIPMFKWLRNEITFICHFYFTNYWKNAVENNEDRSKEAMLNMLNDFAEDSNKQAKRHNRLIQKRYVDKNN
jgi:hypothetical protein